MGHKPKLKGTLSNRGEIYKKRNTIKFYKDGKIEEGFMENGVLKAKEINGGTK